MPHARTKQRDSALGVLGPRRKATLISSILKTSLQLRAVFKEPQAFLVQS